ncbi:S24 family peptidase [Novosphingobium sp. AAP93]|uniref:S24 family peptidase n=1 Tax=Novosphingobium sp. AAP93 TaxID=1523427 RepID=UPI0006B96AA6|nr:S24 family peptidase [Novosphingobium sp. AAP93]KPF79963.1 peptidase S24 [Novosphingobium sp. AAP93]
MEDPRTTLDELIRQRGVNYSAVSRLLGRNVSYIQQYLRKGSPRHLDEQDRQILAQFFGVDEAVLGGPVARHTPVIQLVQIPVLDVEASAGHGALAGAESQAGQFGFDEKWLRKLTQAKATSLSIIKVVGDSMEPTLYDGDEVLVDVADEQSKLRDGIYVLRMDGALNVKRVAIEPQGRKISVVSDNAAYPSWQGLDRRSVNIVGRVLWFGRKI